MRRRFALIIAALGLMLGLTAGALTPATAAPPANKGGGGNGAVIVFSENPVSVGSEYQIIGSGFGANRWVTVGANYDGWTYWVSGVTDSSGNIVLTTTAQAVGASLHEAKEQGRNGSLRLKATATLTVVS